MSLLFRRFALATIIVFLLSLATPVLAINYINNCEGSTPSSAGTWFGTCPPYDNSENNWEGNILPGPSDSAVLGAEYGAVQVNGYPATATVMSVQAMGGLTMNYSGHGIILTSGGSTINGLLLSPGKITAQAGVTVDLLGTSVLSGGVYGPGIFTNSGNLSLNGALIWSGATVVNQTGATQTSGIIQLGDGNTILINSGNFEISGSAQDIRGGGSLLVNSGSLNVNRAGAVFVISPNFENRGSLGVQAGTLHLNSAEVSLYSGSITVEQDAGLLFQSNGSNKIHTVNSPTSIGGQGLAEFVVNFSVDAALGLSVGSGDPATGIGGVLHRGIFTLNADLTNSGRFRFSGGSTASPGNGGKFVNEAAGWVYTRSSGSASVGSHFVNKGNFQLGGGPLSLNYDLPNDTMHHMFNEGTFRIIGGYISGNGQFTNQGEFELNLTDPNATSHISCVFAAGFAGESPGGTVHTYAGNLYFNGSVWGLDTTYHSLSGGVWIAEPGTTIRFPITVTRLSSDTILIGEQSSFPNVQLAEISGGGLHSAAWAILGDLRLEDGTLNVEAGGNGLQVDGSLTNGSGGKINVEPGAQLDAGQLDNGEDGLESVVPELAPIVVLAKAAIPPAIVTPLLNNRGRILPGGRGGLGTMSLTGNLVQFPSGELDIDLGPDVGEGQNDRFTVDGNATLSGAVTVHLQQGYWPTAGQEFTILTTTGSIVGAFPTINQPLGVIFTLRHEANRVVLVASEVSGPSDVPLVAATFHLVAAYPNPFNPATTIGFDLPRELPVDLQIFDLAGRLVRSLLQGRIQAAGHTEVQWDGHNEGGGIAPSGVYFYRLQAGQYTDTRRMSLVK